MTDTIDYDGAVAMISNALLLAGQDRRQIDLLRQADKNRISRKTAIPKQEFLFSMSGKPCFPLGELVAIAGKAKSGKTFVSSMLMAACFRNEVLGIRRLQTERASRGLKVLWYDTEQSAESTQDILCNRILPMICNDDHMTGCRIPESPAIEAALDELEQRLEIYNTRCVNWQERLPMFEAVVRRMRPDLVVLDGIRDLVDDINDGAMAQTVIGSLMRLASETGCCMLCVLHQNKSAEDRNLRGCIGTELTNKAFEVYECGKSEDGVFSVHQSQTRKYVINEKLRYVVGEDGIPRMQGEWKAEETRVYPAPQPLRSEAPQPAESKEEDPVARKARVMRAFRLSFRNKQKTKDYRSIMGAVMHMAQLQDSAEYRLYMDEAIRTGVIRQVDNDLYELCGNNVQNENPP